MLSRWLVEIRRRLPHRHDWHGLYPGWKAEEAGERWRMCVVCGKKRRVDA